MAVLLGQFWINNQYNPTVLQIITHFVTKLLYYFESLKTTVVWKEPYILAFSLLIFYNYCIVSEIDMVLKYSFSVNQLNLQNPPHDLGSKNRCSLMAHRFFYCQAG